MSFDLWINTSVTDATVNDVAAWVLARDGWTLAGPMDSGDRIHHRVAFDLGEASRLVIVGLSPGQGAVASAAADLGAPVTLMLVISRAAIAASLGRFDAVYSPAFDFARDFSADVNFTQRDDTVARFRRGAVAVDTLYFRAASLAALLPADYDVLRLR